MKLTFLALVFSSTVAIGQSDDFRLHSNVGFNYSKNLKYKFNNWSYYYRSPNIKERWHIQLNVNAFRMLGKGNYFPLLGVYNTFNLSADYHIKIKDKYHLFPCAGIQFILDPQQASQEGQDLSGIFALAPVFGVSGKYLFKRFVVSADLLITQYFDGNWVEIAPKLTYTFWKGISINAGINNIISFTYNGNVEMGFYPFIGMNMYLTKQNRSELKE